MRRHAEQDHLKSYLRCAWRKLTCIAQFDSSSRTASSARLHTICAVLAYTFRGLVSYTQLHANHASQGACYHPIKQAHTSWACKCATSHQRSRNCTCHWAESWKRIASCACGVDGGLTSCQDDGRCWRSAEHQCKSGCPLPQSQSCCLETCTPANSLKLQSELAPSALSPMTAALTSPDLACTMQECGRALTGHDTGKGMQAAV